MAKEIQTIQGNQQQGEVILYQPDETVRLEVQIEDETVWLTQAQMAELFQRDRTVIGRHIQNIYKEGELERDITCAKFAHVGADGDQLYEYTIYNLDVIKGLRKEVVRVHFIARRNSTRIDIKIIN